MSEAEPVTGGTEAELVIGSYIRQRRKELNWTLAELARRCGFSVSYVSQVERGLANPTLSSIKRLGAELGFSVGELLDGAGPGGHAPGALKRSFDGEEFISVSRAGERRRVVYPGSGIANELLSPDMRRRMEVIWIEAPPEANSGDHPHQHEGEECGIVFSGAMQLQVADEEILLHPNDAIYFSSTLPHSWRSVGEETLVAIWTISPPTF